MAFQNFPYTNLHELNLDFILREIVRLHPLPEEITALREWVETYFSDVEVRAAVEEILQEWYDDGTLRLALSNPWEDACAGWAGFNKGWNVAKNGDIITMSRSVTVTVTSFQKVSTADYYYSERITVPVDFPIYMACGSIMADAKLVNFHSFNYTAGSVSFIVGSSNQYEAPFNLLCRIMVQGRRPIPPANPAQGVTPGDTGNRGAYLCAKSFLDAREAGRQFAYGPNFMYNSSNALTDSQGRGLMECDTLVMMALLGIDYDHSPYTSDTPDLTYDFNSLQVNPKNLYAWTARTAPMVKQSDGKWVNGYGARITSASTIAWWMWSNSYVFRDLSQVQTGDVVMFRRPPTPAVNSYEQGAFDNVRHMGIMERDGNDLYVIHVTIEEWTEGKVLIRTKLDDFYNLVPGLYRPENTIFARINFSTQ